MAELARALRLRGRAVPEIVPRARAAAVAFAREHGLTETRTVALAVSEAVTNAVVHAYAGREAGDVEITGRDTGGRIVFEVRDFGGGMAPRSDSPGLGVGLPLLGSVAEVDIRRPADGGTVVRMAFDKQR